MEKCSAQSTHIFPFSSCLPSMFFLVCLLCPTCTHNRPEKHLFIHWAPPIQRNLPDAHANKWIYIQVKPRFRLQIALANGLHRWHGSPDGIIMKNKPLPSNCRIHVHCRLSFNSAASAVHRCEYFMTAPPTHTQKYIHNHKAKRTNHIRFRFAYKNNSILKHFNNILSVYAKNCNCNSRSGENS